MLPALLWRKFEKRFVFFPTSEVEYTPSDVGLDYEEVYVTTEDGLRIHAWYVPGPNELTLLCFHGNGGNLGHRVTELALLHHRLGLNLFIFDYRGYGRSEGTPSGARHLQRRPGSPPPSSEGAQHPSGPDGVLRPFSWKRRGRRFGGGRASLRPDTRFPFCLRQRHVSRGLPRATARLAAPR